MNKNKMLNILFCINEMDKIIDNFKGIKGYSFEIKDKSMKLLTI